MSGHQTFQVVASVNEGDVESIDFVILIKSLKPQ